MPAANANETYCTFTLASDVTAGGLPSEDDIAKVCPIFGWWSTART
jgi:hypothetical protein